MPTKSKTITYALDGFFLLLGLWWLTLQARGLTVSNENYHFNFAYALMAAWGGIVTLKNAKEWGGFNSLYGKAVIGFGLSLLSFAAGGITWAYYNYGGFLPANFISPQTISDVPYPGLPDLGFGLFFPFALFGLWSLVSAVGFKYVWQTARGKAILLLTPCFAILLTFLVYKGIRTLSLSTDAETLAVVLNYYYTVGDAIMIGISISLLFLAKKFSGGKLTSAFAFITIGLIVQYFADFIFNYRVSQETYFNADISDMLYATGLYLISVGGSMFTLKGKR
ncbi:MAG: hypothetical protein M3Q44_00700 [bacterium]|nr:hypothetical protein [bacterium]